MISKEGEKVDFLDNVVLSGPVEVWLQKLLDSARATLKEKLADAASAVYDKDSRPQWLVDRVAQIGLTSIEIPDSNLRFLINRRFTRRIPTR